MLRLTPRPVIVIELVTALFRVALVVVADRPTAGLAQLLGHDRYVGLGRPDEPEVPPVLVVKAAGHSAAQL